MQLYPIVLIGVLLMADAGLGFAGEAPLLDTAQAAAAAIGSVLVLLALAAGGVAWCRHRLEARQQPSAVMAAQRIVRLTRWLLLVHFVAMVLLLGWLETVRSAVGNLVAIDEVLAILPTIGGLALTWWLFYPVERRVRDALLMRCLDEGSSVFPLPERGTWVLTQLRTHVLFLLAPIMLILVSVEAIDATARQFADLAWASLVADVGTILAAAVIVIAAPLLSRFVLDAAPMPAGPQRDDLLGVCRRHGVRVRELLVWNTHGSMINAAVMGMVGWLRYVLLTDALLEAMTPRQIEAVMAHEIGHIRGHHMPWLLASLLAAASLATLPLLAVRVLPGGTVGDDSVGAGSMILTVLAVLAAAAVVMVVFGWVSRRFERQADVFAVRHLLADVDPEHHGLISALAVAAVCDALGRIALLNAVDAGRWSWRHGSIAWRQAYLRSIVGRSAAAMPIDRQVRWIKAAAAVILGLAVLVVVLG